MENVTRVNNYRMAAETKQPTHSLDNFLALVDAAERTPISERTRARNVAIVQLLLHTPLKVAELAELDVDQVDLDARELTSVRAKCSVPFNDLVTEALERYLGERDQRTESALFLSEYGTRMSMGGLERLVTQFSEAAGVSDWPSA